MNIDDILGALYRILKAAWARMELASRREFVEVEERFYGPPGISGPVARPVRMTLEEVVEECDNPRNPTVVRIYRSREAGKYFYSRDGFIKQHQKLGRRL